MSGTECVPQAAFLAAALRPTGDIPANLLNAKSLRNPQTELKRRLTRFWQDA